MVRMLRLDQSCGADRVAAHVVAGRPRSRMPGLACRRGVEMKRHGKVGKCGNFQADGMGDEFRARWNKNVGFAGEGQRPITRWVDRRRGGEEWARDVDRGEMQRLGSKLVRNMNPQSGT